MKDRYTLPVLVLVFLVLAAGIVAAGCLYYGRQQDRYRTEVEHKLAAVADLKVGELSLWRKERLGDAGVFFKNSAFSALVRRCFGRPGGLESPGRGSDMDQPLSGELSSTTKVAVLDAQGGRRMSAPDTKEPISSVVRQKVP